MNTSIDIIDALFGGTGRSAILRVLAQQTSSLTGRQVADLAGLSPSGAARALQHLADLGVVSRRPVGRAVLHELVRDDEVVRTLVLPALSAEHRIAIVRASRTTADLPPEVIECLVAEFDPLQIILFGSRTRGEADERSDFDLLVVLPEVTDKHATMVAMLVALGHLAVPVDIIPTDPTEIVMRGRERGSVLKTALDEGEVVYERVA